MSDLTRQQVQQILEDLKNSVTGPMCLTCDCFQGLLTQLELDCPEDITDLIGPLKRDRSAMHGCLGCAPCLPGEKFSTYLKSKNQNR